MASWTTFRNLPNDSITAIQDCYNKNNIPFHYRVNYLPLHLIKNIENLKSVDVSDECARDFFTSWKIYLQMTNSEPFTEEIENVIEFCCSEHRVRLASLLQCLSYEKAFICGERNPEICEMDRHILQMETNFQSIREQVQMQNMTGNMEQHDIMQYGILINDHLTDIDNLKINARKSLLVWQQSQNFPDDNIIPANLEIIRNWFIQIYDLLNNVKTLMSECPIFSQGDTLTQKVITMISELCIQSLIFEEPPKKVIIKGSKFTVKLKYLIPMDRIKSKAFIISEKLGAEISKNGFNGNDTLIEEHQNGKLDKNTYPTNATLSSDNSSIVFKDMSIKKISREKSNTNSSAAKVTEQKVMFFFVNQFVKNGLEYIGWALSMPAVVIVHIRQENQAWAKIIWDNSHAKHNGLNVFETPVNLCIDHLLDGMSQKLAETVGKGLSIDNISMLKNILIHNTGQFFGQPSINYETFCRTQIISGQLSFWDWFYNAMKLLKEVEVLRKLWNDGLFVGFISKDEAETCLLRSSNGTFILRFSETSSGAITISCKMPEQIVHSQVKRDKLNNTAFPEMIFTIALNLKRFYPNIDKKDVVGKYMHGTEVRESRSGYRPITDLIGKIFN